MKKVLTLCMKKVYPFSIMEELKKLIDQAFADPHAMAKEGNVWVEINGGVPIYGMGDEECTAGQAMDELERFSL